MDSNEFQVISITRKELVAAGEQIKLEGELAELCREAGFTTMMFFTKAAWLTAIEVREGESCDTRGRLWDVLQLLLLKIRGGAGDTSRIEFDVQVARAGGRNEMVGLVAEIGPADIDDPTSAITIMTPEDE
ncbi:DUF6573 family protein [Chromobacterium sp. ASV23]|uniref:DUF6573 family protein n=1 Tax=Chromobacterium sp. ASV23 TaxID=2795110 RepID=UPI0018EBED8A|nr:DUF6573 family protein [Chromobacterium sp. ASV23]